jgi:NAD(P)-dependent dehydrogenase (short-subunit alcohol dehydrogenase family)
MKNEILISADQRSLHTGFGFNTTSSDVMQGVELDGIVAIVTGGYSGIGLETVHTLHRAGATVVVPTRNITVARELFKDYNTRLEIEYMDLMDPASIDAFAKRFLLSGRPLHLLINNAGIMASPLSRDQRGYESQFATNHLGHFQLTLRLWNALKAAKGSRVVNVSSMGHRFSNINFSDPNFEATPYDKWKAYGQSKTANILFSVYLDHLGRSLGIRSYAVHPGRILDTNLKKYLPEEDLKSMGVLDATGKLSEKSPVTMKTIPQGASTTLFCATSKLLDNIGGVYCEDVDVAEVFNENADISKMTRGVLPYAVDQYNAKLLWDLSSVLTGVSLPDGGQTFL